MSGTCRSLSLREVRELYDSLRRRYFLDAEALAPGTTLHVPPKAEELRWGWLPSNSGALGMTDWDQEDGDPEMIRLAHYDRSRSVIRATLLHELTHIRLGYASNCGSVVGRHGLRTLPATSAWRREALRLVQLGALQL